MFDIGWQELFIVAAIAIIVVGPRDLPRALKSITVYINKAKSMIREFQSGIDEVAREVDLESIRNDAQEAANLDLSAELDSAVTPIKSIGNDLGDIEREIVDDTSENISSQVSSGSGKPKFSETEGRKKESSQPIPSNDPTRG